MKTRKALSMALNLFIAVCVPAIWAGIHFGAARTFTVLSNLLMALAALAWFVCGLTRRQPPRWLVIFRYAAVCAVGLTFLTVAVYLAPVFGARPMYAETHNLFYHLILPLLAMADFALLDPSGRLSFRDSFFTPIPQLLYAAGYLGNILVNGVGRYPRTNDWYGFLAGGPLTGVLAFFLTLLGTWLLALALRLTHRRAR